MPGFGTNLPSDYIALGVQSAKDTEATSFIFIKHQDGSGFDIDPDIQTEREGGDGQEAGFRYKSLIKADGSAASLGRSEAANFLSAAVLGKTATSSTASHAIWGGAFATGLALFRYVPNPSLPYITVEQRWADKLERNTNCKFNQLEITGEAGKPAMVSGDFLGGGTVYGRVLSSALTPTREAIDPVFFPRGSYVIDGVANGKLTKYKLTVKRGLDDGIQTTDLWRDDLLELALDADVDVTVKYESASMYEKVQMAAAGGTIIPVPVATGSIDFFLSNQAAGTVFRSLRTAAPFLTWTGAKVNRLDPDGKTMYLDLAGSTLKNATDSVIVDVVTASRAALV